MQVFVFTRQALYQLSYLPDLYFSLFADLSLAQTDLEPNLQLWPALNSQKPSFSYSQVLDSQAWVTSPVLCLCLVLWTVSNQTPRSLNGHCSAISLNDLLNCHVISELEMSFTPSCPPLPPRLFVWPSLLSLITSTSPTSCLLFSSLPIHHFTAQSRVLY